MITVNNLSYSYPKASGPTLKNLDFDIDQGEIFGFLGPSGAGKSTTQKVLYKILHRFDGTIVVKDRHLNDWGNDYFERIGVGFELPNHYLKLTARENLQLFASFYQKENIRDFEELFEIVGLEDDADKCIEEFSKGMSMRLNYIRAIMHDPDILFFDEPTAGLDPINAQKIKRDIAKLKDQGKTVFVTTHDMATADELCDRVSFIVDGEIRLTENPDVLKREHGKRAVRVELEKGLTKEFPVRELGTNKEFIDFVRSGEISRINTQEATLEEVFIKVTGKTLKE
ncbi:MAG: ABC transporter ATP-binding protein [Pyrinomonadaceae bacterium]|nr:ABC transporter ATP-binding protein [Pyrinomonadaceae bacterium]